MDDDSDAEPEPVFCEAFSDVADMFEVGRKLGSGNFAKVIQATCKRAIPSADLKAGAQVAIKVRRRGVWGRAWGPRGATIAAYSALAKHGLTCGVRAVARASNSRRRLARRAARLRARRAHRGATHSAAQLRRWSRARGRRPRGLGRW